MSMNENSYCPNLTNDEITRFKEIFLQFESTGSTDETTATINIKDLAIVVRSLGFCPTEAELKEMVIEAETAVPLLDRLGR